MPVRPTISVQAEGLTNGVWLSQATEVVIQACPVSVVLQDTTDVSVAALEIRTEVIPLVTVPMFKGIEATSIIVA